jgi:bis(5'-nucleosyl)-tetraphosphatase (symmetrical)
MSHFAIGDIQGCYRSLRALLDHVQFSDSDTLWFVGDLVNRGPDSLATLRFIKTLGPQHISVLGNHDLHCLAVHYGIHENNKDDTLEPLMKSKDREDLISWLQDRPLFHYDRNFSCSLVHAGVPLFWTLEQTQAYASEAENMLRGSNAHEFFSQMYGNTPTLWQEDLKGWDRLRYFINAFTRMRFCTEKGELDLQENGPLNGAPKTLMPWWELPHRKWDGGDIIFGHWAALNGVTNTPGVYALDTGCVWGKSLTALRLEDKKIFSIASME